MANKRLIAPVRDHYQELTDRIVAQLEEGTAPWQRPWTDDLSGNILHWPENALTGHRYRGINAVALWGRSPDGDPRWCTFHQAKQQGWHVRAGEHGNKVFFYKELRPETPNADDNEVFDPLGDGEEFSFGDEQQRRFVLRSYTVFHASQIEGIPSWTPPDIPAPNIHEVGEIMLTESGARIHYGGNRAFYHPMTDDIHLPPREAFRSPESFYGVALHELGHWTGHPSRLGRKFGNKFGDEDYAREELRAELASTFLEADLGIPHDIGQHAAYVDSWVRALKADNREIFRAAADAQRIADYMLDLAFNRDRRIVLDPEVLKIANQQQPATRSPVIPSSPQMPANAAVGQAQNTTVPVAPAVDQAAARLKQPACWGSSSDTSNPVVATTTAIAAQPSSAAAPAAEQPVYPVMGM